MTQIEPATGQRLPGRVCGHTGCPEDGYVEWNRQQFCARHFVEAAKEYVDFACSWEAYQGRSGRVADRETLANCILQVAGLFAAPEPMDRPLQTECLRLVSFCHGLLRMCANYPTKLASAAKAAPPDQAQAASPSR